MISERVKIVNLLGLHARAAAQLVRLASTFKCRIEIFRLDNDVTADAKSILSVLTLAAGKGVELKINFKGDDEKEAAAAVKNLFVRGFGEL